MGGRLKQIDAKKKRVSEFVTLLEGGVTKNQDFFDYANHKGWGLEVSRATVLNYIREALRINNKHVFLKNPKVAHDHAISVYQNIIKESTRIKDWDMVMKAQDRIVKLLKLDELVYFKEEEKEVLTLSSNQKKEMVQVLLSETADFFEED